jgi:hypothetical protein
MASPLARLRARRQPGSPGTPASPGPAGSLVPGPPAPPAVSGGSSEPPPAPLGLSGSSTPAPVPASAAWRELPVLRSPSPARLGGASGTAGPGGFVRRIASRNQPTVLRAVAVSGMAGPRSLGSVSREPIAVLTPATADVVGSGEAADALAHPTSLKPNGPYGAIDLQRRPAATEELARASAPPALVPSIAVPHLARSAPRAGLVPGRPIDRRAQEGATSLDPSVPPVERVSRVPANAASDLGSLSRSPTGDPGATPPPAPLASPRRLRTLGPSAAEVQSPPPGTADEIRPAPSIAVSVHRPWSAPLPPVGRGPDGRGVSAVSRGSGDRGDPAVDHAPAGQGGSVGGKGTGSGLSAMDRTLAEPGGPAVERVSGDGVGPTLGRGPDELGASAVGQVPADAGALALGPVATAAAPRRSPLGGPRDLGPSETSAEAAGSRRFLPKFRRGRAGPLSLATQPDPVAAAGDPGAAARRLGPAISAHQPAEQAPSLPTVPGGSGPGPAVAAFRAVGPPRPARLGLGPPVTASRTAQSVRPVAGPDPALVARASLGDPAADPALVARASLADSDPALAAPVSLADPGADPALVGRASLADPGADPALVARASLADPGANHALVGRASVADPDPAPVARAFGADHDPGADPALVARASLADPGVDPALVARAPVAGPDPALVARALVARQAVARRGPSRAGSPALRPAIARGAPAEQAGQHRLVVARAPDDGTADLPEPAPAPTPTPTAEPAPAAAAATAPAAAAGATAASTALPADLADQLYTKIERRLRMELLLEHERKGSWSR